MAGGVRLSGVRQGQVTARIVWSRDGEELVETRVIDWVGRDVLVYMWDNRCSTRGVWLDASDVTRR